MGGYSYSMLHAGSGVKVAQFSRQEGEHGGWSTAVSEPFGGHPQRRQLYTFTIRGKTSTRRTSFVCFSWKKVQFFDPITQLICCSCHVFAMWSRLANRTWSDLTWDHVVEWLWCLMTKFLQWNRIQILLNRNRELIGGTSSHLFVADQSSECTFSLFLKIPCLVSRLLGLAVQV